jgi:hypothetical protein
MTAFVENFVMLHAARRALARAREIQQTDGLAGGGVAYDTIVQNLACETDRLERQAAAQVGDGLTILETGARIIVKVDDRRSRPRARFLYLRNCRKDQDRYFTGEAAE